MSANSLRGHKSRQHPIEGLPEEFFCDQCHTNKDYKTPNMLISHYRDIHGMIPPIFENKRKFICSQCPNIYPSEISLKNHVYYKHPINPKQKKTKEKIRR